MIGIICPSIFEYRFLTQAKIDKRRARLVLSGMGKVRALHACHELSRAHEKLSRILLVGYAGSLSPALSVGDLIEPDTFIEQDYDARPFEPFPNRIRTASTKMFRHSKRAAMLTQDRFLKDNPFMGTAMAKRYPRLACDMESYAVAFFCRAKGIPFTALKFISDSADASADHDFIKACRSLAGVLRNTVQEAIKRGGRA